MKIHLVGNLMIDTLVRLLEFASTSMLSDKGERYALVTLHRPSNVDEPEMLGQVFAALEEISRDLKVIFPIHPRTRARLERVGFAKNGTTKLTEPSGYLEFLALQRNATVVITDSGGIQEETTFLGVPCLTVRENTERPVTVDLGTNVLVGTNVDRLKSETRKILAGEGKKGTIPPLWDGRSGERVAKLVSGMN